MREDVIGQDTTVREDEMGLGDQCEGGCEAQGSSMREDVMGEDGVL